MDKEESLSDIVDNKIRVMVERQDLELPTRSVFEKLLSLGEIIDRLTIVNIKLFNLKNEVIKRNSGEFNSWAAIEDIRLVEERSRLKRCIDEKAVCIINDKHSDFNAESKMYG